MDPQFVRDIVLLMAFSGVVAWMVVRIERRYDDERPHQGRDRRSSPLLTITLIIVGCGVLAWLTDDRFVRLGSGFCCVALASLDYLSEQPAVARPSPKRRAMWMHGLLLPWWGWCAVLMGVVAIGEPPAGQIGPFIAFGIVVMVSILALWGRLFHKLNEWSREGRRGLWAYPLLWGAVAPWSLFVWVALFVRWVWWTMKPKPLQNERVW